MARSREFEIDEAIGQALDVFWANGYNKTSLALLTEATGLHKGSFYGTFKSKENLFSLCIERYVLTSSSPFSERDVTAKQFIKSFFLKKLNCNKSRRARGCLLMNSAIELSNADKNSSAINFDRLLQGVQAKFEKAIAFGIENNEFSSEVRVKPASERLLALAFTVEEMGKLGKGRAFLENIVNGTLKDFNIRI